jgi:hypothetical protein
MEERKRAPYPFFNERRRHAFPTIIEVLRCAVRQVMPDDAIPAFPLRAQLDYLNARSEETPTPRDIAVHGDGLGDRRYYRYCAAFDRADRAMQDGYYLEAITLFDSLIFDRLSSRLHHLSQSATKATGTGALCNDLLRGREGGTAWEADSSFLGVIGYIKDWTHQRNEAVHATANVFRSDTSEQSFQAILVSHQDTASKARQCLREFDKLDTESRSKAGSRPPASYPHAFYPENRVGESHAVIWAEAEDEGHDTNSHHSRHPSQNGIRRQDS